MKMDMVLLALKRQLYSTENMIDWCICVCVCTLHFIHPQTHIHLEMSYFHTICICNYASGGSITLIERLARLLRIYIITLKAVKLSPFDSLSY